MGVKHSGKTTFASLYGERYNIPFFDLDDLITPLLNGKSVREFYHIDGEKAFIEKENIAFSSFLNEHQEGAILSFGGGVSDNPTLMKKAKDSGYVIYLYRDKEDIFPIMMNHGLPSFLDKENPRESFYALYSRRDTIYREYSDLIINLGPYGDKEITLDRIDKKIKERQNEWK